MVTVGNIGISPGIYGQKVNAATQNPNSESFRASLIDKVQENNTISNIPAFKVQVATTLRSSQEQKMYTEVAAKLDEETKPLLNDLLKTGVLLSSNSNDASTVLQNLHKIATEPRIPGLKSETILKEIVQSIVQPTIINQKFGDIPDKVAADIIKRQGNIASQADVVKRYQDMQVKSSSCVAASIEFNLAQKMPAEFARMAQELSSQKLKVTKKISLSSIADNPVDAVWLLNEFKIPYKALGWDNVEVELYPDRNAIIRARIQNSYRDPGERGVVDVLMQSAFMNVGSAQTYDSLTDKRIGKFNANDKGLVEIEKNFIESIASGQHKVCVTYQKLDDNSKIVGYEADFPTMLKHIQDTLSRGENIIIGYTFVDATNKVVGGHEITIVGIEKGKDGKDYFVCNDTDDDKSNLIKYPVKEFLPKIHHAGLPKDVLTKDVQFVDTWVDALAEYKQALGIAA